jgi:PBSX family phage terminase large subunit
MFGVNYVSTPNFRGETYIFGQRFFIVGANDEKATDKIRGMTLKYSYCDEATLYCQNYFEMLKSRLSAPGAMCDCTMNADSPYHWFKTTVIDNDKIDKTRINFKLDDGAPFLDKTYIENLKKEYSGVYYKRYVDGEWQIAEGVIYDMFDFEENVFSDDQVPFKIDYYITAGDYGTSSVCTFGIFAVNEQEKKFALVKQYYYDAKVKGRQKTDEEYLKDYAEFTNGYNIQYGYLDPSASSMLLTLRRYSGFTYMRSAKNDVINGIRTLANMISSKKYYISSRCKEALREMSSYCWDANAQKVGEDKPLKKDDHSSDMQRYAVYTHLNRLG